MREVKVKGKKSRKQSRQEVIANSSLNIIRKLEKAGSTFDWSKIKVGLRNIRDGKEELK